MKFIFIPYIALGLVLSLVVSVEYTCTGQDVFPKFYGSPFIFKQNSLGSSLEYYYNISGLLLNVLCWSVPIYFIELGINRIIKKKENNKIKISYRIIVIIFLAFTTVNITIDSVMIGRGFEKDLNYWYLNLDTKANEWGMECDGEWKLF
jgi:hypothetical protein